MEARNSDQSSLVEAEGLDDEPTDNEGEEPGALRLPSANEFAPGQIPDVGLRGALRLVDEHAGDRNAIVQAIRDAQFAEAAANKKGNPDVRLREQRKRANNVLIGLSEYGLASLKTNELTDKGKELLATPDDQALYRRFGEHILRECRGIDVIRAMHDIKLRQEAPTKERLHRELVVRGFRLSRATTDHTQLRAWLAEAGVVTGKRNYDIDEERFAELAGVRLGTLHQLSGLTRAQIAFLRTLRRLAEATGTGDVVVQTVLDHADLEYGSGLIPQDQVRAQVVQPLAEQGWLTAPEKKPGRGGKSDTVAPTRKLLDLDFERLLKTSSEGVPADLRPRLNVPLSTIREELAAPDTHTRGMALELLALRLAYDLALRPAGFRQRSSATGGAEVDLIAEGVHLHHSRWLFQCKNTNKVHVHDVAKEAGMAGLLHAHVIVMVTTGAFTAETERYARSLTTAGHLQVVLVDGTELHGYLQSGAQRIMRLFSNTAADTARAKARQITDPHTR